jgi:hypothetical protein
MAHKYVEENKKEEVKLPKEFKQHTALFSNKEASKFPPSYEWDHKIKLQKMHLQASIAKSTSCCRKNKKQKINS